MLQTEHSSLWSTLTAAGSRKDQVFWGAEAKVPLPELIRGSSLGGRLEALRGCSVLLAAKDQLMAALALIELDGIARRIVICPPDVPAEQIPAVLETAAVEAVVSERDLPETAIAGVGCFVTCSATITPAAPQPHACCDTEWVLFTSGTTGLPKLVVHTLSSLRAPIKSARPSEIPVVWSTFYDIRRYGGLQIFLRAVLGGGSLVLSSAGEATGDFLIRAGAHGVTHISGTPSHWRRALMSPQARRIAPRYVRLSGEIADQTILDHLRSTYPDAGVGHAFASTEAGVAFEVDDGFSGFSAALIGKRDTDVELKVVDGSLGIRSARIASGYLGNAEKKLADNEGFVDTGDMVELSGDRYYFVGRADGVINVGGRKVHPEEVEVVINRHPGVQMSLVKGRKSPITGAVVVADVVLERAFDISEGTVEAEALKHEIVETCHGALAPHKVPAAIRFVPALAVTGSGKLARSNA
jgi:acyl-coenzyme A synthetase/AMP-(fatty) acid ligase